MFRTIEIPFWNTDDSGPPIWEEFQMSQTGKVTASVLNFRPEPSTRRPPLGQLKRGDLVQIISREGKLVQNSIRRQDRVCFGNFLDDTRRSAFSSVSVRAGGFAKPSAGTLFMVKPYKSIPDFSRNEKQVARTWNRFGGLIGKLSEVVDIDPGVCPRGTGGGIERQRILQRRPNDHPIRKPQIPEILR